MQASLTARIIGAARLDTATYEAVEHDEAATSSALLVVVLAAIAAGIGTLGSGRIAAFILGVIAAIVSWAAYAGVAYLVGSRLLAGPQTQATWGQLLRTLGFAQAPRLLLVLGWIPILGVLISLIVFIWTLITTVVAIRQALDFTTGRAIGTAVIAWLVLVIVYAVILIPVGVLAA
ncbi:YIP1 family protein [Thermomicrobiaceae bacterium CFH 74404]|uniref:YIP1 family protein n=1 Tax=Thermalbibacter longus TaxID=2951981 RepID=A0AA42BBL5_9BACT|nr:YIP1 family protein [Thermalbibacter longus]MCM8749880.1 YIP1 family protein [Thermalbibacter longus]